MPGRTRLASLTLATLGVVALMVGLACRSFAPPDDIEAPPATSSGASTEQPPAATAIAPQEPLAPSAPQPQLTDVEQRAVALPVRVGLAADLSEVTIPCCTAGVEVRGGEQPIAVRSSLRILPDPEAVAMGVFRLQVTALRDPQQAEELAARLAQITGLAADARFDAASGLFRVRLGRFASRVEAERARPGLAVHGLAESWVVSDGGGVEDPALRLEQDGETRRVPGRWLTVAHTDGQPVTYRDRRYRGRLLVYLNDRGSLSVINELPLEDYLRSVVAREMGPGLYPELEALKAQAVAARTYTLRNLGEFDEEGYDICATPRCQVYSGVAAEHPLSDQAVMQTAGEVLLYQGELADTLYSATCGGHTEDVGVVFPLKNEPYLRAVSCIEAGPAVLNGTAKPQPFPLALARRLVPVASGAEDLTDRLARLAGEAGLATEAPPAEEPLDAVLALYASVLDPRLQSRPSIAALAANPPSEWVDADRSLARLLAAAGDAATGLEGLPVAQQEELLFRLAQKTGVVVAWEVRFLAAGEEALRVRDAAGVTRLLPFADLLTYDATAGQPVPRTLSLFAGDRLQLFLQGQRLLAVVQRPPAAPVQLERSGLRGEWSRFRSLDELARSVRERIPGFELANMEILERGVSGRVGRLALVDPEGRREVVEGLAVRWTLDLPDTRFSVVEARRGSQSGWTFTGRGWGHGVGLCQVGAFAMGRRGHAYEAILDHYYSGLELGRVSATRRLSRQVGGG